MLISIVLNWLSSKRQSAAASLSSRKTCFRDSIPLDLRRRPGVVASVLGAVTAYMLFGCPLDGKVYGLNAASKVERGAMARRL